jgi:hypothetical protein
MRDQQHMAGGTKKVKRIASSSGSFGVYAGSLAVADSTMERYPHGGQYLADSTW